MPSAATLNVLATHLDRLPDNAWVRIAVGVVALILVVVVARKIVKMNKLLLAVIGVLVLTMVGFNWIYERDEPAWATPVVSKLATFFPTKDAMK